MTRGETAASAYDAMSAAPAGSMYALTLVSTSRIADVESDWRALEAKGIDSPGQSFDFLSTWIASFGIGEPECQFVVARIDGKPVAALALHRMQIWGMPVLVTFPGGHVGTNAPLIDTQRIKALSLDERSTLWQSIIGELKGADLAYLCCLPAEIDGEDLFSGFGRHTRSDELHRAQFPDWETCDREQRSRSRRKHDKQQGAKLEAMGVVSFETRDSGEDVSEILDVMFKQRHDRFRQQGIDNPFESESVRSFYRRIFAQGGALKGRLHILRLDGQVVAVRYNLILGDRMFCLISSMSVAPEIQPGSPGKQCLLRVMQSEFDNGIALFDMGCGLTDEKRHWCNVHIPLRHHYAPLTMRGYAFTQAHRAWQSAKVYVKSNDKLFQLAKDVRTRILGRAA